MAIATSSALPNRPSAIALTLTPVVLGASLLLTGASGLIYQVVWFRLLGLSFGVTVHATSAVLAAFMAGLALGSLLAARFSDRMRQPLRWYGVAEIVIGVLGLLSLPLLDLLTPLYRALGQLAPNDMTTVSAVRFVLAFGVLLLPTTLMGATLPIVVQGLGKLGDTMDRRVSVLYAANTAGAILGAFLAGFILIGVWGIVAAVAVAATMNIMVGVVWAFIGGRIPANSATTTLGRVAAAPTPRDERPLSRFTSAVILAVYGVSGAVALAYEVVWTRLLSGLFPGTTYSFTLMLCAVLAGIALGSWVIGPFLARRADWVAIFAAIEAGMGVTAVISLLTIANGNVIEGWARRLVGSGPHSVVGEFWFMGGFSALVILPTALLMGMAFPVAAKIYAMGRSEDGARVGRIYGVNTIGAIVGSLAGGLILIPWLGAQHALWLLAVCHFVLGVIVLAVAPTALAPKLATAAVSAVVMVAAVLVTPDVYQTLSRTDPRGERMIWHNEGPDATVRVVRSPDGSLILYINSEGQATDHPSTLFYHYHLGHIGPLLHPNPRDILVIGLGGGATPGATALHRSSAIDVVELYHGVVEAARLFDHINYGVLDRPNVTIHVNDGRNFLLMTDKKYDIIEADIIQARNAGSANLYAADYYRLARNALRDDGLMVQWVDDQLP
ncbi:MAG: fused MFS/spermidine synthase, partial [Dehalococcoidia bacterium]|nr:fused MFS/spermidine synthase [Dehalococcoidia bacterium]